MCWLIPPQTGEPCLALGIECSARVNGQGEFQHHCPVRLLLQMWPIGLSLVMWLMEVYKGVGRFHE